ncbi:MAG: hypothetical protein PHW25_02060 [Zoogloea sp.]|uniref:hypothetical protein n=1 Tax=Zoogloea sp. TaxID=49181 RepID=UPI002601E532|nr:hypothetical protein [Zoogloea sp.]MDD3325850.1 hypothetical protein [Zoogloea sp.]
MHIVEATLRQAWQRLFGPEFTAFLVDDEWPSLLFVPDLDTSRPDPVGVNENASWPEDGTEATLAA